MKKKKEDLESEVKNQINKFFEENYPEAWTYMPVQSMYGKHGIPDHLFCVPITITPEMIGRRIGLFVAIEAKAFDGTLKGLQRLTLEDIGKAGGIAGVVRGPEDNAQTALELVKSLIDNGHV